MAATGSTPSWSPAGRRGHPDHGRRADRRARRVGRGAGRRDRRRLRRRRPAPRRRRLGADARRDCHRPRRRARLRRVRVESAAAGGVPAQPGHPDQRARATPATGWSSGWPPARPSPTMRAVWGVPVLQDPAHVYDGRPSGRMANVELTLPGSIMVNAPGRRFVNEAVNYHDLNKVFRTIDSEHRRARQHPGLAGGRQRLRRAVLHRRHPGRAGAGLGGQRGDTVEELAQAVRHRPRRAGRDGRRVQQARRGRPRPAFHRGESAPGPLPRRRPAAAPVPRAARAGPVPRDPDPARHARHLRRARHRRRRPGARPPRPPGRRACSRPGTSRPRCSTTPTPVGVRPWGPRSRGPTPPGARSPEPDQPEHLEKDRTWPCHAVIYRYADDAAALDEHRPRHRDHLRALHEAGRLVVSGPLAEGGGPGALLIFRADVRGAGRAAGWTTTRSRSSG